MKSDIRKLGRYNTATTGSLLLQLADITSTHPPFMQVDTLLSKLSNLHQMKLTIFKIYPQYLFFKVLLGSKNVDGLIKGITAKTRIIES